jgi:hypothetical protein
MKRRELIKSLAMVAAGAGTFLFSSRKAEAGSPFDPFPLLEVGETYKYSRGLKVTFLAVSQDNRCPAKTKCDTPGNAKIKLRIRIDDNPAQIVTLNSDTGRRKIVLPAEKFPPGIIGIPKSYVIKVTKLTPDRPAKKDLPQALYQLQLSISIAV